MHIAWANRENLSRMMKRCILLSITFYLCTSTFAFHGPIDSNVSNYIENYWTMAILQMKESGIPASVILAQAICESNSGSSTLAISTNNHFAIKCKSNWTGMVHFEFDDDLDVDGKRIESCFRKYDSIQESYKDHTTFLTGSQRYRHLFKLPFYDYKNWCKGLQECYYSSNPEYGNILIGIIETYGLAQFDDPNLLNVESQKPSIGFEMEIHPNR